jgi:hypothetical protein
VGIRQGSSFHTRNACARLRVETSGVQRSIRRAHGKVARVASHSLSPKGRRAASKWNVNCWRTKDWNGGLVM